MSSRVAAKEAARARRLEQERAAAAHARRKRRLSLLGGVVAIAVVVVLVLILVPKGGGGKRVGTGLFAGIPEHGLTLGSPDAPVTLVEFGDLKCPVCRAYSQSAFPVLVRKYVRTGKVKMVFRVQHFVGQPPSDSLEAARMAEAAGQQDKLWPFVETFYDHQQDELSHYVTPGYLRKIGAQVPGLDVDRALAQRNSPQVARQLEQAATLFQRNGFSGTPSFLLGKTGGKLSPLSALTDPAQFEPSIDALLRK